jgi:hypothetical protein
LFAFPVGCGPKSDTGDTGGGGGNVEEPIASIAASVALTSNPTAILTRQTATVTADARDAANNPVPDGTTVRFSLNDPAFGTVTESATTTDGIATATFTAATQSGPALINANSGDAAGSVTITIEQASASNILFESAIPSIITIQGTSGITQSEIQFVVLDGNNDPLEGINVTFAMPVSPGGSAYIEPDSASSDASGIARVWLHSGLVAGSVTVSATANVGNPPTPLTVETTGVSIGGGVPSDKRFSVDATILNLPGIGRNGNPLNGVETEVTAWLADRFGAVNILEGTTVSFGAEVGLATETASTTLDAGTASVTVRTQAGVGDIHAEDVLPEVWEEELQEYLSGAYGYTGTTAHPRDGLCTVAVSTRGEEHWDDNGDGIYDPGDDIFTPALHDTAEDPFYDYNDNDTYDGVLSSDPYEFFVDAAAPYGEWTDGDGVWSADTYIFRNFPILITGPPITSPIPMYNGLLPATAYSFTVPDGGDQSIGFLVCDENFNQLVGGSSVEITSTVGGLAGLLSQTYPTSNQVGPDLTSHLALIEYVVTIYDQEVSDADPPESGEINVKVIWVGEEQDFTLELTIPGTVD